MKNVLLIILCLIVTVGKTQIPAPIEERPAEKQGPMGKAYISEQKKIGGITYSSDININISIRKERDLSSNHISKTIFFNGTTAEGPCEGFVDESEADEAINALKYISDSLLTRSPENEMHFAKRFTNSTFVIYASFVPKSGTLFAKADWDINIVVNEHEGELNQGSVHLKKSDLGSLIQMLQTGRERLKTF